MAQGKQMSLSLLLILLNIENGRQPVYVSQLDASKAFDRVSYSRLFNVLLDNNVCPYIVRLLCYMYLNQNCCVKWNSKS